MSARAAGPAQPQRARGRSGSTASSSPSRRSWPGPPGSPPPGGRCSARSSANRCPSPASPAPWASPARACSASPTCWWSGGSPSTGPNPAHRRAKLLAPTDEGRAAIARIDPGHAAFADRLAEAFGRGGTRARPYGCSGTAVGGAGPAGAARPAPRACYGTVEFDPDHPARPGTILDLLRTCGGKAAAAMEKLGPGIRSASGGVPAAGAAGRGRHGARLPGPLRSGPYGRRETRARGAGRAGGVPGAVPAGGAGRAAGRRVLDRAGARRGHRGRVPWVATGLCRRAQPPAGRRARPRCRCPSGRSASSRPGSRTPSRTSMPRASSTATSSRPTCWSPSTARASSTSASPAPWRP